MNNGVPGFDRLDQSRIPLPEELAGYVATPLWSELCGWLGELGGRPRYDYSRCGMERGWNVKYRRGSRTLCTLYPRNGGFCAMVSVGPREQAAAERLLPGCTGYVRQLYHGTADSIGSRWLMIEVTSPDILRDTMALISTRITAR